MSLHDAITQAAQAALEPYLSPDMVEKLTNDIVDRARPEIEAALSAFVGFEVGKPIPARGKAAPKASPARKAAKRKEPSAGSESETDPGLGDSAAGSEMMMG